jgi:hypothetical protein
MMERFGTEKGLCRFEVTSLAGVAGLVRTA